jgi:hypothetical protein
MGELLVFNGDNSPFGAINGKSRLEAEVNFRLDLDTLDVTEKTIKTPVYGIAQIYEKKHARDVPGKPIWWKQKNAGAEYIDQKQMEHDPNKFKIDFTAEDEDRIVVRFLLEDLQPYFPWKEDPTDRWSKWIPIEIVKQLVASTDLRYRDIDAQISVTINNWRNGSPMYQVSGKHNRFPAYEVYVNGEPAYQSPEAELEKIVNISEALDSYMQIEPVFKALKPPIQ